MTITATHPLTKHLTLPGSKLARQPRQKEEYLVPTHFRPSPFKTPSATPTGLPSTVWSRAHTSGVSHCHYKAHPPTWTHLDTPQRLALKFHRTVISRWFEHRPITDAGTGHSDIKSIIGQRQKIRDLVAMKLEHLSKTRAVFERIETPRLAPTSAGFQTVSWLRSNLPLAQVSQWRSRDETGVNLTQLGLPCTVTRRSAIAQGYCW